MVFSGSDRSSCCWCCHPVFPLLLAAFAFVLCSMYFLACCTCTYTCRRSVSCLLRGCMAFAAAASVASSACHSCNSRSQLCCNAMPCHAMQCNAGRCDALHSHHKNKTFLSTTLAIIPYTYISRWHTTTCSAASYCRHRRHRRQLGQAKWCKSPTTVWSCLVLPLQPNPRPAAAMEHRDISLIALHAQSS